MDKQLNQLLDKFAKLNEDKNVALSSEHYDAILEDIDNIRIEIIHLFNCR